MVKCGRPDGIDTSNLRDVFVGGGPASAQLMTDVKKLLPGTNVSLGFGMTEICSIGLIFRPNVSNQVLLSLKKPNSSGMAVQGLSLKVNFQPSTYSSYFNPFQIVDIETEKVLGPNQLGELRIKGKYLMNGYFNMDSSDAFDSEGYIKSGDLAYYDEDRCFFVMDRIKEMFKYHLWHIAPAVIEAILLTHPAVAKGVVIGIPNEEDVNHAMGVVVLKSDCKHVNPDDIRDYVDRIVDDRKKLRAGVKIVSDIPVTPSGKPQRRILKNMILNGDI